MEGMPEDPFSRTEEQQRILTALHETSHCELDGECVMNDKASLAKALYPHYIKAMTTMTELCSALYAHGDTLLAEEIVLKLQEIGVDLLPFWKRNLPGHPQ